MRKILILGAGSFGYHVAKTLYEKGHEVVVIDNDKDTIQKIRDYSTEAILADATDKETLDVIGAKNMEVAVISLGEKIEPSILATLYLKEMGVRQIVVKALTEDHGKILSQLGATEILFPEKDVAMRLAQRLCSKSMIDYLTLTPGYSITEIAPSREFIGKTLKQLALRNRFGVQVIAIIESIFGKINLVPASDFIIKDSDILVVLGKDDDIEKLSEISK